MNAVASVIFVNIKSCADATVLYVCMCVCMYVCMCVCGVYVRATVRLVYVYRLAYE